MTQFDPLITGNPADIEINPELQKKINTPVIDPEGFNKDDEGFLLDVINKVKSGQINLYNASSLYNYAVVDKLDNETKVRVEFTAQNLLALIREVISLHDIEEKPSYQIINLIHKLRVTKEKFELKEGDVFII